MKQLILTLILIGISQINQAQILNKYLSLIDNNEAKKVKIKYYKEVDFRIASLIDSFQNSYLKSKETDDITDYYIYISFYKVNNSINVALSVKATQNDIDLIRKSKKNIYLAYTYFKNKLVIFGLQSNLHKNRKKSILKTEKLALKSIPEIERRKVLTKNNLVIVKTQFSKNYVY